MDIASYIMPHRPHWNSMGWKLPAWFKAGIKRIDPSLVLQFMPPTDIDPKGLDRAKFPIGAWIVCRKMNRTGWLHARWVMQLANPDGSPMQIRPQILRVLRLARDFWKAGKRDRMESEFDQACLAMMRATSAESKDAARAALQEACRKHDLTQAKFGRIAVKHFGGHSCDRSSSATSKT
jgi:hypothetical protein